MSTYSNTDPGYDPLEAGESKPALSFKDKPIGHTYSVVPDGPAEMVQSRNFDTGELDFWDDAKQEPKMAAVFPVLLDGEPHAIWATKPSSMFRALQDAQKAARAINPTARIGVPKGGELLIKHDHSEPNKRNPKLADQKIYVAKYTPPIAADPFGDAAPKQDPWEKPFSQEQPPF